MEASYFTGYVELADYETNWRGKYNFLYYFYLNIFMCGLSYTIVIPSLFPYIIKHGGSEMSLAMVLCFYSIGEFIGSLGFGFLHDLLSTKNNITICASIGLVASAIFFTADFFSGDLVFGMLFFSRFLTGLWAGGQRSIE
jgi:MFS family permease